MKKIVLPLVILLFLCGNLCAQTDTLSSEAARQLLQMLKKDTSVLLKQSAKDACLCIDSIKLSRKSKIEITENISECITKHATLYQFMMKINDQMFGGNNEKNRDININVDKSSPEFQRYYFEIERWLKDSCTSINRAVASENQESYYSYSKDAKAIEDYNTGLEWMKKENLEKALTYFNKAVKRDEKFAFAWDNIGICNRKLGKYDEALYAYNKSLEIDPSGITPLHNIPVVYQYQNKYDKALEAYQNLQKEYPEDPEGYYGAAIVLLNYKVDHEKALQNLCKAYNIYIKTGSPYRVDAEKLVGFIYKQMKEEGKEKRFMEILKENNISPSGN